MTASFSMSPPAAAAAVGLLRGVLYRDRHAGVWHQLVTHEAAVRDYLAVIGLDVFLDDTEGYAFCRQREIAETEPDAAEQTTTLPRLIQRRALSFPVSLLCVWLRKKVAEHDASSGEVRVIITREQIVEAMRTFLPANGSEAKIVDRIDGHIRRAEEYGFVRRLEGEDNVFEVRRIVIALVDADWLNDYDAKLELYQRHAATSA
ncbi:MAG: DUF4194 domain-containing protein [Gammaproteobacteria bacterium]